MEVDVTLQGVIQRIANRLIEPLGLALVRTSPEAPNAEPPAESAPPQASPPVEQPAAIPVDLAHRQPIAEPTTNYLAHFDDAGLQFAEPIANVVKEDCIFYHSFEYPNGERVEGDWDMRDAFDAYIGQVSVKNKRVLDIGTASGFLSFEAERRGARVVSFDALSTEQYCRLPFRNNLFKTNRELAIRQDDDWLNRVKKSYWYSYARFESRNRAFYGDVHHIPSALGMFDVVIVGQFLVHNRSGIDILESIAEKSSDIVVITEGMIDAPAPSASFIGRANAPDNQFANWLYSPGFYEEVMGMLGFSKLSQEKAAFRCNHPGYAKTMDLVTLVFKRNS